MFEARSTIEDEDDSEAGATLLTPYIVYEAPDNPNILG
jgi:hypothetical protein